MRPAPERLPVPQLGEILGLGLGQEYDVGFRQYLSTGEYGAHQRLQHGVGHAEALAVARFEDQLLPNLRGNAFQMQRVEGQTAFGRLAAGGQDAESEEVPGAGHFFLGLAGLVPVALSMEPAGAAAAFFSARFSLMDLPDFLDAAWRGDLSDMFAPVAEPKGFLTLNHTGPVRLRFTSVFPAMRVSVRVLSPGSRKPGRPWKGQPGLGSCGSYFCSSSLLPLILSLTLSLA